MGAARIIVMGVELYGLVGIAVAVGFVTLGILRAMPHAGPVTWGARVLLFPGAMVLWPWVLRRWLAGGMA
ncbi:MAG TPA: hypothetical protein VGV37_07285 [Aliidongia sp.]|uniref:hypothetical protein n=1 Tax=Aliidongia sp. TaxID=1914230 RepID=UPI002DDD4D94|nr:hypothetical protein [Aliidongia sp.]HEV2674329.1 hypothetical protein [Aliidongia sp.]